MAVLVVDIGGTHLKVSIGKGAQSIKIRSGPKMTPAQMVREVREAVHGWTFDVVSVGYPGVVLHGKAVSEPHNLGSGWVGFNFRRAFGKPVKVTNDAAMQALGSYRGGRMLFLGLGTGLGTALIVDGILESMEIAHLPYKKGRTYEEYVGKSGLKRLGKKKWRRHVNEIVAVLKSALEVDDVVIGGGNAKLLRTLPRGVRKGDTRNAIRGGVELWQQTKTASRGRARATR